MQTTFALVPTAGLIPYARNSRTHSDAQVAKIAAIACEKHGRMARLMELDPKYCDVIITRWQDFTGQTATLESTGQAFGELKAERVAA